MIHRLYKVNISAGALSGVIDTMAAMGSSYPYGSHAKADPADPNVATLQFDEREFNETKKADFDLIVSFLPEVLENAQIGYDAFYMHINDSGRDHISQSRFRLKPLKWSIEENNLPDVSMSEFSTYQKFRLAILSGDMDTIQEIVESLKTTIPDDNLREHIDELWSVYGWLLNSESNGEYIPSIADLYHMRYSIDIDVVNSELRWLIDALETRHDKKAEAPAAI